jgi:hypothetical protein
LKIIFLFIYICGGGYVEVECYCEVYVLDVVKKYGDMEFSWVLDLNYGCLDIMVGWWLVIGN